MNALATTLSEAYTIVGSCIDCTTPASLPATLALILIGAGLAFRFEGRNMPARGQAVATKTHE
jgi:hypothetical protein